ncbi:PDZ domain-containing protein [Pseudobacteriovorax antillogorgiicola]|uniref:PDZ domain-containing protein n=1 Tax=Pseudobacteriovorax antillogorgiicola TaxID=1513793 RepID=A0A1Y6CB95_9BACT|nr:PDZ domain-containing protein [Pseudobacteriovorax antillogorgiicola]TCS49006.1 hypothetical protein EDD56_11648 [Pseudobacteriovorax antillogorgiicola]SMF53187.1 hypothetical protein SAMN06296036_116106 [Pseudobacteriovorax antillogorgiicola]
MRLCMYFILSTLLTLSCSKVDQETSQLHLRPLTVEDKLVDFDVAVNQFKNYYAPYQYKEQRFGVSFEETFAALRQEVIDSQSDQEFYDILGKLVATFNDGHVSITIPNMGSYALPFVVDHFNGNYVVASVEDIFSQETGLMVGDRLVSMDGRDAESIVNDLMRYQSLGYERSSRR